MFWGLKAAVVLVICMIVLPVRTTWEHKKSEAFYSDRSYVVNGKVVYRTADGEDHIYLDYNENRKFKVTISYQRKSARNIFGWRIGPSEIGSIQEFDPPKPQ